jgi:hypothetical protein
LDIQNNFSIPIGWWYASMTNGAVTAVPSGQAARLVT